MGRMSALGMAEAVRDKAVRLDGALVWHLRQNHYPPLPLTLVEPAKRAISKANRGEMEKCVSLGPNIACRLHGRLCPVWHMVEVLHLDSFVDPENGVEWYVGASES